MKFKNIRSFFGKFFSEHQQMKIIIFLSDFFWQLRKYYLGVEIDYPTEFLNNWKKVKKFASHDKERNFTIYQLIKIHNSLFEGKKTNILELGVDRGATLSTIATFVKNKSQIYGIDSFGNYSDEIKKNITFNDNHYLGSYKPFTKRTRFKNFNYLELELELNSLLKGKDSVLKIISCYFPNIPEKTNEELADKKFSFVHLDFDLYQSTIDSFNFIKDKLEDKAIILVDDYNFINQEGVKKALNYLNINLDKSYQTSSGQLIIFS